MRSTQKISYPILILLLVVIISSGISFSRYSSVITNSGDASSVIVKEYELTPTWGTDPTNVQYPGITNQIYNFGLENTKDTDLYYRVIVNMNWNANTPLVGLNVPLVMNLYMLNSDDTLTLVPTSSRQTVVDGMQVNSIYMPQQALILGKQTIDYRLKWSWGTSPADRNYHFANQKIDVSIDVEAEQ